MVGRDAVPEREPAAVGEYGRGAAAHAGCGRGAGARPDPRVAVRLPVQRIGRGGEVDRGTGAPLTTRRVSEVEIAERPCLRPVLAIDTAFEDQHILVLVIEDDVLERPVEAVGR